MPELDKQDIKELHSKIEQLEKKLERYEQREERAWNRRYSLMKSAGGFLLFGPRLKKGVYKLLEGDVSKDNISDMIVAAFYRITRIGVFAVIGFVMVAIIPAWLLWNQNGLLNNQNGLLSKQNIRLDQQTNLLEAGRRSSLVLESGNVMGLISQELNDKGNKKDSLSQPLIARIIALSRTFKPYKYLETDTTLTDKKVSPERAHLLVGLYESKLDSLSYFRIFTGGDFSHVNLNEANLYEVNLSGAKLIGADLIRADLRRANLIGANLSGANLSGARLSETDLSEANLSRANLYVANLYEARLSRTDLSEANLSRANLIEADLSRANLSEADLSKADLIGANLSEADLSGAKLSGANLSRAKLIGTGWIEESVGPSRVIMYGINLHEADLKGTFALKRQIPDFIKAQADTTGMVWVDE